MHADPISVIVRHLLLYLSLSIIIIFDSGRSTGNRVSELNNDGEQ
jgi:hypothetical protein